MVKDHIEKLEAAITSLQSVDAQKKAELKDLVESLKSETLKISQTHKMIAQLNQSVKVFEGAHPQLVEIVDEIALLLSRIGI